MISFRAIFFFFWFSKKKTVEFTDEIPGKPSAVLLFRLSPKRISRNVFSPTPRRGHTLYMRAYSSRRRRQHASRFDSLTSLRGQIIRSPSAAATSRWRRPPVRVRNARRWALQGRLAETRARTVPTTAVVRVCRENVLTRECPLPHRYTLLRRGPREHG